MAQYRFTMNEELLIVIHNRFRQQRKRTFSRGTKILGAAALIIFIVLCALSKLLVPALALGFLLLFFALAPFLDNYNIRRSLRSSPLYNADVHVTLTPNGVAISEPTGNAQLTWGAFIRARRFSDGFLLFTAPQLVRWLPDSALCEGTVAEVEHMVKERISDFKVA
jgi:hypothetical protein